MATTLQLPPVFLPTGYFSVEEYHRWEGYTLNAPRTELIRGSIVAKSVPSPSHNLLVRRLFWLAHSAHAPGTVVRKEEPITLADSEPEPDVAVVKGEEDDFGQAHPTTALLAVEVALTSEPRDRDKLDLYAQAGIPEYWIVLPEDGRVEVHTSLRDGHYTQIETYGSEETVVCGSVPGLSVGVDELFRV